MSYYPAFLDLKGRLCLVVGGGKVALRKSEKLIEAGARVRLVSPRFGEGFDKYQASESVEFRRRAFLPEDLEGCFLVVSAADDQEVNRQVSREAHQRGLLCNVVDQPALSSFIAPALVSRGRLQIAISTAGASPALARKIRRQLEAEFGPEYGPFLELMARLRPQVLEKYKNEEQRRRLFHALVDSPLLALIRQGRLGEAEELARSIIEK